MTNSIFQNKALLIAIAVLLVLVEFQIFFIFSAKSGEKHTLQILNDQGTVVYETDGQHLTQFKKYYFEATFGPFENYEKKLVSRTVPFPFRAWFVTAVGFPMGFTLLFAFIVSAVSTLFGKKKKDAREARQEAAQPKGRVDQFLAQINRMNIFMVGGAVFLIVLAFWVLPNLVTIIGQTGLEIIDRYRWFFAVAGISVILIFAWFLYLRFLLAKKALEAETHLREHQMNLNQLPGPDTSVLKIEDKSESSIMDVEVSDE